MSLASPDNEDDTTAEKAVDAVIHLLALLGAGIALDHLLVDTTPKATSGQHLALVVYGLGLLGTLTMSGLYNLSPRGRCKGVLRICDRSMIFVMIAGSYTPFVACACPPVLGATLCIVIWTLAAVGITICVAWRSLYNRISNALYLGMGWLILAVLPSLAASVPAKVLALLVAGGVVYSLGVIIHTRVRVAFHTAAWHGMVVTAAGLHLAAVALVLP